MSDLEMFDFVVVMAVTNLVAFFLFWLDKQQAHQNGWRIPERNLLLAALLGGVGAWLGQQLLRHKTRKHPFRTELASTLFVHLLGVAALVWWLMSEGAVG